MVEVEALPQRHSRTQKHTHTRTARHVCRDVAHGRTQSQNADDQAYAAHAPHEQNRLCCACTCNRTKFKPDNGCDIERAMPMWHWLLLATGGAFGSSWPSAHLRVGECITASLLQLDGLDLPQLLQQRPYPLCICGDAWWEIKWTHAATANDISLTKCMQGMRPSCGGVGRCESARACPAGGQALDCNALHACKQTLQHAHHVLTLTD